MAQQDRALDFLVAEFVMGYHHKRYDDRREVWQATVDAPWRFSVPHFSTDIAAAWLVVERMVARMGYDDPSFLWEGPLYKPVHHYLTREGYPLGTTCWYVEVESDGRRTIIAADTAPETICRAALFALGVAVPDEEGGTGHE